MAMQKRVKPAEGTKLGSVVYPFGDNMEVELYGFLKEGKGKVLHLAIRHFNYPQKGVKLLEDEQVIGTNDLVRAFMALAATDPDPDIKPR